MAKPTPAMGYGAPSRPYRRREFVEGADALQDRRELFFRQSGETPSDDDLAVGQEHAGFVIELANAQLLVIGNHEGNG
jgi:hypothetical protein